MENTCDQQSQVETDISSYLDDKKAGPVWLYGIKIFPRLGPEDSHSDQIRDWRKNLGLSHIPSFSFVCDFSQPAMLSFKGKNKSYKGGRIQSY